MSEVIDFKTRLRQNVGAKPVPAAPPGTFQQEPLFTVAVFDGPNFPMLIHSASEQHSAAAMREIASQLRQVAMNLDTAAHQMDPKRGMLPRLEVVLYASALMKVRNYNPNGVDGKENPADIDWMKRSLPHALVMLDKVERTEEDA